MTFPLIKRLITTVVIVFVLFFISCSSERVTELDVLGDRQIPCFFAPFDQSDPAAHDLYRGVILAVEQANALGDQGLFL